MNRITFTFNKIILEIQDPRDWEVAKRITGKVEDVGPGRFEMSLSTHNMQRIYRAFSGSKKPQVVSGQRFLDDLKAKLEKYKEAKQKTKEVLDKEKYPVAPNGKFIPYQHQTLAVGVILNNPFASILLSCGLGKTGSTSRAVEIEIAEGKITKGSVLVSAPLSILHTSWGDDISKFTSLKYSILWTPEGNKVKLSDEKVLLKTYKEKPQGTIAVKNKTGTLYRHRSGAVQEVVTILDNPDQWVKYRASWKVAVLLDGSEVPFGEVHGRIATKENTRENFIRSELGRKDVDVYLINHDGVRIYEDILKEKQFEWVIVDESTKIKSPKSKVSHAHVNISWNSKRRNILSGTPNPNGFIDLWQQFYFLDRGMTLEPSMKDFLTEYFRPVLVGYINTPGGRKEAIKYEIRGSEERQAIVDRVRSTGICLEQRDCIDLPPRTDMKRIIYMTKEQEAAYDKMSVELVAELKNTSTGKQVNVDAVNVLAKIMKLRQITSGFLTDKSGNVVHLANNPKLEDLDEFIEELGDRKVVIAAQFREEIRTLIDRYRDLNAEAIYGDVAVDKRSETIRRFQSDTTSRVIILQPAAAAHGITLTAASHLVFLSLDYNFEYYYQTAKRIERIGQKNPIFVVHSLARYTNGDPTIDEDLLEVLQLKSNDRDALFSDRDLSDVADHLTSTLIRQVEERHGRS